MGLSLYRISPLIRANRSRVEGLGLGFGLWTCCKGHAVMKITSPRITSSKGGKNYSSTVMKQEGVIDVLDRLDEQGRAVNTYTYVRLLRRCADQRDLISGKRVHAHITQSHLELPAILSNSLLNMYIKCGKLVDARNVFDALHERDNCSWGILLAGYTKHQCFQEAFETFKDMRQEGVIPDKFMFTNLLNMCASFGDLKVSKQVHAYMLKCGIASDVILENTLVDMYAKCGSVKHAREVFNRMDVRDVVSWNVMIGGLAQHGCVEEVFDLFRQMQRGGLKANPITYISLLTACTSPVALTWGKDAHAHIIGDGLQSDVRVGTALVKMYAKCGSIKNSRQVFDEMVKRNLISWNVMIGVYSESGHGEEAFQLYRQMQEEGLEPNSHTFLSILNPCVSPGALEWVKEVHAQALKAGLQSDVRVGNALVNMYAKSGSIKDARQVFEGMVERDVISWSSMIGGLALHGCGQEALQLFEQMKAEGFIPNEVTFMGVLSACSHAGLVDECRHQFASLSQVYGILPSIGHYGCIVNLLGRVGHFDEAEKLIKDMPMKADATIWGSLLGACRIHGNVKLAERAAECYLKLEPDNAGVYVVLSNIYAVAGLWDHVVLVRNMMKARGVRKEPGRTWIEVDERVHSFIADDRSHPQAEQIYTELTTLTQKIKGAGYVPDTQFVMHDVEKQQKEESLCYHSEKLAIAYGLISTPRGKPIRIFKNLRVCSDCHNATKFITMVTGREIVARDGNRFHHFKDGVCSCGDYW